MTIQRYGAECYLLPSYNRTTFIDDISLIKVDSSIPFSNNVKPIQLPSKAQAADTYLKSVLVVSGFGITTSQQLSTILQYTEVIGISNDDCKKTYGTIFPSVLCTAGYPKKEQGTCSVSAENEIICDLINLVAFREIPVALLSLREIIRLLLELFLLGLQNPVVADFRLVLHVLGIIWTISLP